MREIIIESKIHGIQKVLIDEDDWGLVEGYRWYVNKGKNGKLYVRTNIPHPDGGTCKRKFMHKGKEFFYDCRKLTTLPIHRLITSAPRGMYVDHIDGNPLNNTRQNLRVCTNEENCRSRGANKNNTSGYKGVKFDKRRELAPWQAYVGHRGKRVYCGNYATKEEAARAYDKKALQLHGKFAQLNFSEEYYE